MMGKQVAVNIVEVKNPDINSQLVAEKLRLISKTEFRSDVR